MPIQEESWIHSWQEDLTTNLRAEIRRRNGVHDRQSLTRQLEKPLAFAKRTGLPLYCGEWGCIEQCPREARLAWYRDVHAMLETHGIAWANWDYKGGFGIAESSDEPDQELIDLLIQGK